MLTLSSQLSLPIETESCTKFFNGSKTDKQIVYWQYQYR